MLLLTLKNLVTLSVFLIASTTTYLNIRLKPSWNTLKIANVTGRQTALFVTYFIMINLPREHELKEEYSFKDDILFILYGFSCFASVKLTTVSIYWSNLKQSNRRSAIQRYFHLWWVFFDLPEGSFTRDIDMLNP